MSKSELHFELEPSCILACKHCSSQAIKSESLQYTENDVVRLVKAVDPLELYFTGGEPLLFSNLMQLFSKISSQAPRCKFGLFTTGITRKKGRFISAELDELTQLYRSGLRICYVSLYSDEEHWHDYMTGVPGSFQMTVQAIKNMKAVGIDVRVNLVVTRFNVSHIKDIISFVSALNSSEVRLLKLIRHGNAVDYWNIIGVSDKEYSQAIASIHSCRKEFGIRITFSSIPQLAPCRPIEDSSGCQARKNLLYVTLNGDIYPCACVKNDNEFLICNIKDEYFEKLININMDNKPFYTSCLAKRDNFLMNYFDILFSQHFSDFSFIGNTISTRNKIMDFMSEARSYFSKNDFFDSFFELNRYSCLYYEIHAFFIKSDAKTGEAACYISADIDIGQVYEICKIKYSHLQIHYQVVDTSFIDHYIKEELLQHLVSTFDSVAFNPENYLFIKECIGL